MLQWGRDPRAADSPCLDYGGGVNAGLQWGRDPRAADSQALLPLNQCILSLQWGRDPRAADRTTASASSHARAPRFNGAATQGPRIEWCRFGFHEERKCFNGAATQGPRIGGRELTDGEGG